MRITSTERACFGVSLIVLLGIASSLSACDPEWTLIGDVDGAIFDIAMIDLGGGPSLYVAGDFSAIDGVSANNIARLTSSGWEPLPGDGFLTGNQTRIRAIGEFNGELFIGGSSFPSNFGCNHVARFDGALWDLIFGDCVLTVTTTVESIGGLLYIGSDDAPGGLLTWDGFGASTITTDRVRDIVEYSNGIYVAKSFESGGGVWSIAPGGWVDIANSSFATNLTTWNGDLFAGGGFDAFGGAPGTNNISAWDGVQWRRLGAGTNGPVQALSAVESGLMNGLYVGGDFSFAGSAITNKIAKWNGVNWEPVGEGLPSPVTRILATPSAVFAASYDVYMWACPSATNDCDGDGTPDDQECDFDGDGVIDDCDDDVDGDGVPNEFDLCQFTNPETAVDGDGRPRGDMNDDCLLNGVDLQLYVSALLGH